MTQLGSSRAATEGHVERRLALALMVVLVIWGALVARLFYLQVIEGDRYRAAIEYLAPDGDKRSHVFEGSRDELREQIGQSEDLPPAGRKHLLNALNLKGGWPRPPFMVMP